MNQIEGLRDAVDVVHIEHLRGARYGLDPRRGSWRRSPVVWDSVDCISDLFEQSVRNRRDRIGRWINRVELSRTRAYEGCGGVAIRARPRHVAERQGLAPAAVGRRLRKERR